MGIDIDSEEGKKEFKDLKEARGSKFTDRDLNNPLYAALNKMRQYDKNFARSRRADQSKYHDEEVAEGKKKSELKPKLADPNRPLLTLIRMKMLKMIKLRLVQKRLSHLTWKVKLINVKLLRLHLA